MCVFKRYLYYKNIHFSSNLIIIILGSLCIHTRTWKSHLIPSCINLMPPFNYTQDDFVHTGKTVRFVYSNRTITYINNALPTIYPFPVVQTTTDDRT